MFEKEAEEWFRNSCYYETCPACKESFEIAAENIFQKGAKFGYNKGKEDVKYDLMMKLKDEGIVKPLKDSILRNERLSSQEQQELCAWIECAMEFGENLDKCAKELEEANKANEWHYPSKGELPKCGEETQLIFYVNCYYEVGGEVITRKRTVLGYYQKSFMNDDVKLFVEKSKGYSDEHLPRDVIAWKEIVPPKED